VVSPLAWVIVADRYLCPADRMAGDIRAAGLRDELSFTSFRYGGLTETGDAELTDREILEQSRHTIVKVLPKYVKRTVKQIATGTKKRRAAPTKDENLSE
jgi:hypothetical protein